MLYVNRRFLTRISQTPWARKQRDFWQKNPQHASHLQIIFTLTNIKSEQPHFGIFANASGKITRWAHVGDQVFIHKQPINPSQKWVCDVLDLRHLPSLTEAKLQQLSMQQKTIKYLMLSPFAQIKISTINAYKTLRTLIILIMDKDRGRIPPSNSTYLAHQLNDKTFDAWHTDAKDLSHLVLGQCQTLSLTTAKLPNLRHLSIMGCRLFSNQSLTHLAQSCPKLVSFSFKFGHLSKQVIHHLIHQCPKLTRVENKGFCIGFKSLNLEQIGAIRAKATAHDQKKHTSYPDDATSSVRLT